MATISAFLGDRRHDREAAAGLITDVLAGLEQIDPMFSSWRPKASSKREAATSPIIPVDRSSIAQQLQTQRTDLGDQEMPELGFSFSAWTQSAEGRASGFSATLGLHAANPNLVNSLVIDLPDDWAKSDARTTEIVELLRSTASPDEVVYLAGATQEALWTRPQPFRRRGHANR